MEVKVPYSGGGGPTEEGSKRQANSTPVCKHSRVYDQNCPHLESCSPSSLDREDQHQLPVLCLYKKKAWTRTLFFWNGSIDVLSLKTGSTLPFKVLLILDNVPDHPGPHELNSEGVKVAYLPPNTTSLIQPLHQGIIRTFKANYTRYSMKKTVTLRKRTLIEHHKSLERLYH